MVNLKEIFLLIGLLISAYLPGSWQQGCVNPWEADLSNTKLTICPVPTASGEMCQFPFTYNNVQYRSCIITSPNNPDYYPQCLTPSNKWSNCTGS